MARKRYKAEETTKKKSRRGRGALPEVPLVRTPAVPSDAEFMRRLVHSGISAKREAASGRQPRLEALSRGVYRSTFIERHVLQHAENMAVIVV
jgi:hypothetical protein